MYIGNIITSSKIEDDNFKVCRKLETIDDSLPTLIVGWEKTKEIYGDKVSILHKKIDDKTQWTFTTKERKGEFSPSSYCKGFAESCMRHGLFKPLSLSLPKTLKFERFAGKGLRHNKPILRTFLHL